MSFYSLGFFSVFGLHVLVDEQLYYYVLIYQTVENVGSDFNC